MLLRRRSSADMLPATPGVFVIALVVVCTLRSFAGDVPPLFDDVTSTHLPSLTGLSMDARPGDVDGDGDLDIVIAHEFRPNILLINDGTGVFTDESAARIPQVHRDSEDVGIADFDGNGWMDIVVVTEDDFVNELYFGTGNGFFSDEGDRLPVTGRSNAVLVGDFGGDAKPDILIGNNGQNHLLINDGQGFFTDETSSRLPSIFDITQDIEAGLIDDDEHIDLLIGNEGGNRILINNGAGVIADETELRLPLRNTPEETREADLGDVDGDDDLDILFANVNAFVANADVQNRILINNGSGVFTDETDQRYPVDEDHSFDGDFVDVDNDGHLDIVTANLNNLGGVRVDSLFRVFLIAGDGTFADETTLVFPMDVVGNGLDVEAFDADGDGHQDLFLSSRGGVDRLLISNRDDFFVRGDGNFDAQVDISDGLAILFHLFMGTPITCEDALDATDDGLLDIGDPLWVLRYLFLGQAAPLSPGPLECGPDPSDDVLDCQEFTSCHTPPDF